MISREIPKMVFGIVEKIGSSTAAMSAAGYEEVRIMRIGKLLLGMVVAGLMFGAAAKAVSVTGNFLTIPQKNTNPPIYYYEGGNPFTLTVSAAEVDSKVVYFTIANNGSTDVRFACAQIHEIFFYDGVIVGTSPSVVVAEFPGPAYTLYTADANQHSGANPDVLNNFDPGEYGNAQLMVKYAADTNGGFVDAREWVKFRFDLTGVNHTYQDVLDGLNGKRMAVGIHVGGLVDEGKPTSWSFVADNTAFASVPNPVPLPASALSGLALLGSFCIFRLRRNAQQM